MQRPIGYWLRLVDRLIEEEFGALLREQRLGRRHWQVLNELLQRRLPVDELDGQLAPFLGDGEPSTRPAVAGLVDRGWVGWSGAEAVSLSPAGVQAHSVLSREVTLQRDRTTAGVSQTEYETALAVLRRIAENLGWSEPA